MTDTPTDTPDDARLLDDEYDDDEDLRWDEPLTRREQRAISGRRRRWPAVLASFALIALVGMGVVGFWAFRQIDPPGDPGDDVAVTIPEQTGVSEIADLLEENGIITNSLVFRGYLKVKGTGTDWQAGDYVFQEDMSFDEAIEVLDAGPAEPPFDEVTIPEGYTVFAGAGLPAPGTVVQRIADPDEGIPRFNQQRIMERLLDGSLRSQFQPQNVNNIEGMLFPATYRVGEDQNLNFLLTQMVQRFDEVATEAGIGNATQLVSQATNGQVQITPYEAIIVASLIEREAQVPEERPMMARVIYNRLQNGVALGIDASLNYALGRPAETDSDLATDSPYNLREVAGLPPTPIAIPGEASLRAAVAPAQGQWMYYVLADQSGRHTFTNTYEEFLAAKEECQAAGLC